MGDFESIWDHSYAMLDGEVKLLIHEDFDAGLGGTLFDGSVALAAYVENLVKQDEEGARDYFKGKCAIELGAGCGFPGLFVAKLGAKRVVLTDYGGHVALLGENIELNALEHNCEARSLDWTNEADLQEIAKLGIKFDFILCADVVYAEEIVDPLLHVLDVLSTASTKILFSHPKARSPTASNMFWENLPAHGFQVEKIPAAKFVAGWKLGNKQFANAKEGVFVLTKRE